MSKQFWGVIVAVIIVFVCIFAFTGSKSNTSTGSNTAATNNVEGAGKDHVTLVEYGDFECPYCGEYYPVVKQVVAAYDQDITFQFRNFPLTSIHPNAFAGARAAEAAAAQGKFWQMHDQLYEENEIYYQDNEAAGTWVGASDPLTYFDTYAKQLGLNVTQFNTDYNSSKVNAEVNADMSAGNKLGVNATPTFFLDGKQISVGESASQFETLIKAAIATKTGTASSSTNTTSAGTTVQSTGTAKASTTTTSK